MQIKPPGNFFYVSSILPHTQEPNATSVILLYQLEYRISYNTVDNKLLLPYCLIQQNSRLNIKVQ